MKRFYFPAPESQMMRQFEIPLDTDTDMDYAVSMNNDKMIGRKGQPFCGSKCCGVPSNVKSHKRSVKRRERQAWKKNLSNM